MPLPLALVLALPPWQTDGEPTDDSTPFDTQCTSHGFYANGVNDWQKRRGTSASGVTRNSDNSPCYLEDVWNSMKSMGIKILAIGVGPAGQTGSVAASRMFEMSSCTNCIARDNAYTCTREPQANCPWFAKVRAR